MTAICCRSRSEEHTSELQSRTVISYAVFCLKKKNDFERIEALKPAIEACGISTLSQSPMLGFHKQMDNRIKLLVFFLCYGDHRDLHNSPHSFPTRRSSDLFALLYLAAVELYDLLPHGLNAVLFALSVVVTAVFLCGVQRCIVALHPTQPTICSVYHPDFWWAERIWKVHPIHYLHAFDGTPFKNVLWRLMGVQVGRRTFDDGAHISEPTLTSIGDESVLNYRSKIQCHSQEDGTFKCDRTRVGAGCTIGVGAFVLYGVTMGDGSVLAADSFLMKGEDVPRGARWGGNPAMEM